MTPFMKCLAIFLMGCISQTFVFAAGYMMQRGVIAVGIIFAFIAIAIALWACGMAIEVEGRR